MVSPLISLIEDQTRYLNGLVPGSAAMLSAGMDKRETNDVYRRMRGDDRCGGGGGVGAKGEEEEEEEDRRGGKGKGGSSRLVMVLVTPEKVGLLLFSLRPFSSHLVFFSLPFSSIFWLGLQKAVKADMIDD